MRADEAEVGAEQHHPLEADVQHACPLGDGLAEGGEHQRQAGEQAAGDDARPEDVGPDLAREDHVRHLRKSGARRASRRPGGR